jgi:hypothetical protein
VLALLALICFILALFNVALGEINLVTLGLAFIAAHLLFGGGFYPVLPVARRG